MSLAYAREVIDAVARGDVTLKGEREYYHGVCATMLDREAARVAAAIAEELARIESEASAEAGTELAL
jgi:Cu/Ag efflux pump CusA